MSAPEVHGLSWNGDDRTLCGISYDAYDTGDHNEPVILQIKGKRINCQDCIRLIKHCKALKAGEDYRS